MSRAIQHTRQLIRLDHLSERYYQLLIRLYIKKGDKARAVRTYHQCVEVLEKEMGLDPSPETQKLYRGIMERDAPAVETPRVTEKQARLVGRETGLEQPPNRLACLPGRKPPGYDHGRGRDWQNLPG